MFRLPKTVKSDEIRRDEIISLSQHAKVYKLSMRIEDLVVKEYIMPALDVSNETKKKVNDEITIMATFDHDNIMKLRGTVESQEIPGLIMDYMPMGTLRNYIDVIRNDQSADANRFIMMLGIANALEYMHELNFIHRNLTSENILIEDHNTAKITGFGSSVQLEHDDKYYEDPLTVGTFPWYAPEAIKTLKPDEKRVYSKATDVYSFATLIWVMSSFKEPYKLEGSATNERSASHQTNILHSIKSGGHEDTRLFSEPTLKKLCVKAWSINPEDRPTIGKFVQKLQVVIHRSNDTDSSEDLEQDYKPGVKNA